LFTFVGDKKRSLHCDPGKPGQPLPWIVPARTPAVAQAMLDRSPQARQYCSDGYPVYEALLAPPVTIKPCLTKTKPARWKRIMPDCATIWPDQPGARAVFRTAYAPCGRLSSGLSSPGTAANCPNAVFQPTLRTYGISYVLDFIHSQ